MRFQHIHFSFFRIVLMTTSTFLKAAAIISVLILGIVEASAQLPVRTRQLQLLGSTSGTLTHQAAATTTSYTLTWPAAVVTAGNNGFLQSNDAGTMSWFLVPTTEQLVTVDVNGAAGQVAYFTDGNTITSSPLFSFSGGTVTVGDATNVGTVAISDGSANTGSFVTTSLAGNRTYTLPDASGNVPVSTNTPGAGTTNYVAISNGDGTFTWVVSSTANLQRGRIALTAGNFTQTITFPTAYVLPVVASNVVVTANILSTTGNLIQITGVTLTNFTIESTAPFTAGDEIMWSSNVQP